MRSAHFWFPFGADSLLGHIDAPQARHAGRGAVIVPPFGWEDVSAYRPLRFLARTLAAAGIPTLRYDLPGTGDSSGDAQDPALFESWIHSVDAAAEELRRATGVEEIAAVGIRLGAMLALAASARGANFNHLVLWGASCTGRSVLRELRAVANAERWESLSEAEAPPPPLPGFEAGGFLLAPETLRSLEELNLAAIPAPACHRILLLSRDDLPHDPKLTAALKRSSARVEMETGQGYSAMTALPHESLPPEKTGRRIASFLTRDLLHRTRPHRSRPRPSASKLIQRRFTESIWMLEQPPLGLFGILAEPSPAAPHSQCCVLYLNAGGVRHIGPNRMWVESARRWASRGVTSLRLDLQGIGESEGAHVLDIPQLYRSCLVDQVQAAIADLRTRTGAHQFALAGLCSGAFWAFHAALRIPEVRAAVLLNPRLLFWDPGADQRRLRKRAARSLTRLPDWLRLIHGGVTLQDLKRFAGAMTRAIPADDASPPPDQAAQAWEMLDRAGKRVTLIFREGEPLLAELDAAGQLPPETGELVRCIRVANAGHTFRPLWAQKMAHQILDAELAAFVGATAPAEVAHG